MSLINQIKSKMVESLRKMDKVDEDVVELEHNQSDADGSDEPGGDGSGAEETKEAPKKGVKAKSKKGKKS